MEKENFVPFNEIPNIESLCAVLGLVFPEHITEFQKAALTLAHLMASIRDYVLKGVVVPNTLVDVVNMLSILLDQFQYEQTK